MQYHEAGSSSAAWDTYWFEKNLQGEQRGVAKSQSDWQARSKQSRVNAGDSGDYATGQGAEPYCNLLLVDIFCGVCYT